MSNFGLDNITKKKLDFVLNKLPPTVKFMKPLTKLTMNTMILLPVANNSNCNLTHSSCKSPTISFDPTDMY